MGPFITELHSMGNLTEKINKIRTIKWNLKIHMLLRNLLIVSRTDQLFF
jgi:hypothetical protein